MQQPTQRVPWLASISTIIDGYTDETAGALMKGSPVGKHVFGRDVYPSPFLDEGYVRKYIDRIDAARREQGRD